MRNYSIFPYAGSTPERLMENWRNQIPMPLLSEDISLRDRHGRPSAVLILPPAHRMPWQLEGYITLAGLWASPISGASMNPARSFGPDLVLLVFSFYGIFPIGPIMVGLITVITAFLFRGPGGDTTAKKLAQGEPGKGNDTKL
jgi:hypothetical protein